MKVLYIAHSCPYPPNKGDRIRSFNILKHLSRKHEVLLIYPAFSQKEIDNEIFLKQYCSSVAAIKLHRFSSILRGACSILGSRPITTSYFFSPQIQHAVNTSDFDLGFADCSSMAQYILQIDKPRIVDFVDIDSEKWKLYATLHKFPKSFIFNLEKKRLKEFEDRLGASFDACCVVSENERLLLQNQHNVFVVKNGVDVEFFSGQPHPSPSNATLLFSGAMNYFPNVDGALFFCKEIFPIIQQKIPHSKFIIAGMHPTKPIQMLANDNIIVTGYVPDIRNYLAQADVCVVPLRLARGIQNKILEAMAMGIPVVATHAANQGIQAEDHTEILLADTPEEFAQATIRLLESQSLRNKIVANARALIQRGFLWEKNLTTIDTIIESIFSRENHG